MKNDMLLILDTISLTKDTNHLVETTPLKEKFTRFTRQGLQSKHATAGLQFMQKIIEFVVVLVIRTRPYNSTGFALCQQCGCTIL